MTSTRTRARLALGSVVFLALLFAGWSFYWFYGQSKVKADLQEIRAAMAAEGWTLACAGETWGGYPFRFEFACREPRLSGSANGAPVEARAASLKLYMQAYNPFHMMGILDGPTAINGLAISHRPLRQSFRYDARGNWDSAVEIPALAMPDGATAEIIKLFARSQDGKLQFAVDASNLKLAKPAGLPAITSLAGEAETDAGLLQSADPLQAAAATGTPLTITRLQIAAGNVTVNAAGSLSLDAERRLNGKLASEVSDLEALLSLIAPPLNLSAEQVAGAKTVIGLIGGNAPGQPTKLDLIAKDGEIYFGPFKIADVPPLR